MAMVTGDCGQRRCKHCNGLFRADVRNRRQQQYCGETECRRASKKASQDRWLRSDKGRGYFRGPPSVERVRQWRAAHPGYGKRGVPQGTLQDISTAQVIDKQGVAPVDSSTSTLFRNPLQDLFTSQQALLIGLIAKPPEAERPDARSQRPVGIRDLTGTKIYARNVLVTDRDSNLTGSTLQDDIAETTRRYIHSGQEILGCSR